MSGQRLQQVYDHRLIQLVQRTRDLAHATGCGVPASTARGWLGREPIEVITHPAFDHSAGELRVRLARLERRLERLTALLRIALAILSVLRPHFTRLRVPHQGAHVVPCWRRPASATWASPSGLGATRTHWACGTLSVRFLDGDHRLPILRLRRAA